LVSKIDPRYLVSTGFLVFGICSLIWGNLTLQISPWSLLWPVIISGFSLGLVFVPLSVVSLGDLRPEQVGNGSGLYNLMRNIGGSIGISVVQTILTRHTQVHRSEMVHHVAPMSVNYQNTIQALTDFFSQFGSPVEATQQAIGRVGQILEKQAELWSYVDDFRYMAIACFCCVPLVWLLRKVRARAGAVAAH
jgi:DHA2 family multidrug resistance protein